MTTEVYVFADWEEFKEPALVGTLRSSVIRQKEHFSFSYDTDWLQSPYARQIDPALNPGEQHFGAMRIVRFRFLPVKIEPCWFQYILMNHHSHSIVAGGLLEMS